MSTFSCPVVTIASVEHNPNSDNLDVLKFEEIFWVCQDVRGKRKVGDKVVYIPIDAMVDCTRPEFKFIEKNAKIRDGKPIARIKTIRLRGATSQGLVIDLPDITGAWEHGEIPIGYDLSGYFGVTKYEPPQEAVFSANAKGTFPAWCPKTDCERYQNHNRTVEPFINDLWFATLKLDGTSLTVFYDSTRTGDEFGVCSRNQELKPPSQDPSSSAPTKYGFSIDSYWKSVIDYQLLDKVKEIATVGGYTQVALQFELCGEGIQKNRLGLKGQKPFLFDIYVTMPGVSRYLDYMIFLTLAHRFSIETVPFVSIKEQPLTYFAGSEMNKFQELLDTLKYENGQLAEGGVFTYWLEKEVGKLGRLRVKYINPNYLLQSEKHDE